MSSVVAVFLSSMSCAKPLNLFSAISGGGPDSITISLSTIDFVG
jgi:hypothetical protein